MGQNAKVLHQFIRGMRQDFDPNAERNDSYEYGINGRLYGNGSALSYSSLEGTTQILDIPEVVKYMGYWPFVDELIIFVKKVPGGGFTPPSQGDEQVDVLKTNSFNIDIAHDETEDIFSDDINTNTTKETFTVPVRTPITNPSDDYNDNFSCVGANEETIDYTDYFTEILVSNNYEACYLEEEITVPENNTDFTDAIYSITKDDQGTFSATLLWEGYLNVPIDGKIVTFGVNEGNYYKRIYFTDYSNEFRVVNIKDKNLVNRTASEFAVFQGGTRLSPQIESIADDGEIPVGTVFYTYRLITENGQTTQFVPPSRGLIIAKDSGDLEFSGGDVQDISDKHVTIQCNVPDSHLYARIQAIALEYEAINSLTNIRDLGTLNIQEVNYFDHYGNEPRAVNVAASDVFERKANWRYGSGISAKDNILFVSGIRNEPIPVELKNIQKDFALHGWASNGATHDCLMNPDPTLYRFFDPKNTDNYYYINKKRFNTIQVFGNYTVRLVNLATGDEYSTSIVNTVLDYTEQVEEIHAWLSGTVEVDGSFAAQFPNLTFDLSGGNLFFLPVDDGIATDFSDYVLKFNTTQVVQDVDEDINLINTAIGTSNLIYGGISLGYNRGNGVKIRYGVERETVLSAKATDVFPDNEPILNLTEPSLSKGWMKGEIYRIGMRLFDRQGTELFVVPFGDVMIPAMGEPQMVTDSNNNVITLLINYRNSYFEGNEMVSERITMEVSVRLSCQVQQFISSYQIMYVPRDEANRTILCQGVSAPMERYNIYSEAEHIALRDEIANKWVLPFNGGPTYDARGLGQYDIDPFQEDSVDWTKRVTTNRSLMYFDSPDLIFGRISDQFVSNGKLQRTARLNTDHTPTAIRASSGEVYPKFSRKIYRDELAGDTNGIPWQMNVSVFKSEKGGPMDEIDIDRAEMLSPGIIIPGSALDVEQDVSNHAMTLGKEQWFFSGYARNSDNCNSENGAKSELWNSNNISRGYSTLVIKTAADVFTSSFIDQSPFLVSPEVRDPYTNDQGLNAYDTHGLFNIVLERKDSIYGGRTEEAYSKNFYKPVSDTIPVLETSNSEQKFTVEGDVYCTLWIRTKNDFNKAFPPDFKDMNNSGGCNNADEEEDYTRWGAWVYAAVVESEVEPRLTNDDRFYKKSQPFDFGVDLSDFINEAYFQDYVQNALPQPFLFKDDPNLTNAVASSQTKITGDVFDAWTIFPANNLYELEKDAGAALNITLDVRPGVEELFVVQETQTSQLIVNPRTMIQDDQGGISIQQSTGDGGPIVDHKIVSKFGTLIRRALVPTKDYGFCFIDERRLEFVKVNEPLLIRNQLSFLLRNLTSLSNRIVDAEGYYDDNFKETNIQITWANGTSLVLSYNEALQVFNGWMEYAQSIFLTWDSDVFAPKNDTAAFGEGTRRDESKLHNLNNGTTLELFDEQKSMKLGVTTYLPEEKIAIFTAWAAKINVRYPFKQMILRTSTNQAKVISGQHHRYQIRESLHSVPLKNRYDTTDLRGQWLYLEVEFEHNPAARAVNQRIDLFNFANFLRESYQ